MSESISPGAPLRVTAYDWVPNVAQGLVRDLRVRWALEEAGLPYEPLILPQGTQTDAANLVRQPFGQVPAIEVEGTTMFESGAIVWQIAEKAPDALLPHGEEERRLCLSWLFAALDSVEPPIAMYVMTVFYENAPQRFGLPDGSAAMAIRPAVTPWISLRLKNLADALGDREFLVGGRFTAADLMMTTVLRIAERFGVFEDFGALRAYVERHQARPAFKAALEAQLAPFRENAARYERAA